MPGSSACFSSGMHPRGRHAPFQIPSVCLSRVQHPAGLAGQGAPRPPLICPLAGWASPCKRVLQPFHNTELYAMLEGSAQLHSNFQALLRC